MAKLRDECLAIEEFASLLEAQIVIADWRRDYNDYRPHSALEFQSANSLWKSDSGRQVQG